MQLRITAADITHRVSQVGRCGEPSTHDRRPREDCRSWVLLRRTATANPALSTPDLRRKSKINGKMQYCQTETEIHSRQRLRSASNTDVVHGSCRAGLHLVTAYFRSQELGVERVTARCHLRVVPFFISATSGKFSVSATYTSIILITVSWSW